MILYFDTETTGLHPGQVCQLTYIMQDGKSVSAKNFYFTVDSMDFSAFMVHGLSMDLLETLSNGKCFGDYIDEIERDFLSADVIISHNTSFDFMFMRKEFERQGKTFICQNEFCTMKKSTPICKLARKTGVGYKYPKLSELCAFLSITDQDIFNTGKQLFGALNGAHDARFDTVAVYLAVNKGLNLSTFEPLKEYL